MVMMDWIATLRAGRQATLSHKSHTKKKIIARIIIKYI